MKKNKTIFCASLIMYGCIGIFAEDTMAVNLKPQVVTHDAVQKSPDCVVVTLNPDEQAFVAKLTDQNRKTFSHKLTADQRKNVMKAVENGANADQAVEHMLIAIQMQENQAIVQVEKRAPNLK